MKILIAYDGSEYSDAALEDLKRAGLPKTAEIIVLSVADIVAPPMDEKIDDPFPTHVSEDVRRALEHAERKVREAASLAKRASEQIKSNFPEWHVNHQALADSPAWALIRTADEWQADLIVLGARGHSVLGGRLILGSVSQRVLYEAGCSVRVARARRRTADSPLRLVIGVDNSPYSLAAVDAVCRRNWPMGTEVRLLAVVDTVMCLGPDPRQPSILKWIEVDDENNWDQVRQIFEPSAIKLRSAALDAAVVIRRGNPTDRDFRRSGKLGSGLYIPGFEGSARNRPLTPRECVFGSCSARTLLGRSREAENDGRERSLESLPSWRLTLKSVHRITKPHQAL